MPFFKKRTNPKKRARRPVKRKVARIPRNVSGNFFTLRCRVPFTIKRSHMSSLDAGELVFNMVHAPWRNLDTGTQNMLYHEDFTKLLTLYQNYKLGRIDYTIRRPKQWVNQNQSAGGDMIIQPTIECGSQVLHSVQMMAADNVTNVVQGSVNYVPRVLLRTPSSWKEAVDNQDRRFHVHGYKTHFKRTWLPSTRFEKRYRSTTIETDQDIACGGLCLMCKDDSLVPEFNYESPENDQVMFEGFADVYMNYCRRT